MGGLSLVILAFFLVLAPQATTVKSVLESEAKKNSKLIVAACNQPVLDRYSQAKTIAELADELGFSAKSTDTAVRIGPRLKTRDTDTGRLIQLLAGLETGKNLTMAELPSGSRSAVIDLLEKAGHLASQSDLRIRVDYSPYIAVKNSKGEVVSRLFLKSSSGGRGMGFLLMQEGVETVETKEKRFKVGSPYRLADIILLSGKEKVKLDEKLANLPVVFFGRTPKLKEGLEEALRLYYLKLRDNSVVAISYGEALGFEYPVWGVERFDFTDRDLSVFQREQLASLMRSEKVPQGRYTYSYNPMVSLRFESPSLKSSHTEYVSLR